MHSISQESPVRTGPPSSYLQPGLTARKHPRNAMLGSMLPSAAAGAAVIKTADTAKPGHNIMADAPGADLPPVIAPARYMPSSPQPLLCVVAGWKCGLLYCRS